MKVRKNAVKCSSKWRKRGRGRGTFEYWGGLYCRQVVPCGSCQLVHDKKSRRWKELNICLFYPGKGKPDLFFSPPSTKGHTYEGHKDKMRVFVTKFTWLQFKWKLFLSLPASQPSLLDARLRCSSVRVCLLPLTYCLPNWPSDSGLEHHLKIGSNYVLLPLVCDLTECLPDLQWPSSTWSQGHREKRRRKRQFCVQCPWFCVHCHWSWHEQVNKYTEVDTSECDCEWMWLGEVATLPLLLLLLHLQHVSRRQCIPVAWISSEGRISPDTSDPWANSRPSASSSWNTISSCLPDNKTSSPVNIISHGNLDSA